MTRRRRRLALLAAALLAFAPRLALACPVCFAAEQRRLDAYIGTTILLSLLPLGAIGGIAWLVSRRSRTPGLALGPESTAEDTHRPDHANRHSAGQSPQSASSA